MLAHHVEHLLYRTNDAASLLLSLLARHSEDLRWRIEFDAGDLQGVMNKGDSYREHAQTGTELKIVSVPDDHLAIIKALISELNGKL
jgi:hypothetical protein